MVMDTQPMNVFSATEWFHIQMVKITIMYFLPEENKLEEKTNGISL